MATDRWSGTFCRLSSTERVLALQSYTNALEDYMYSSVMGSGQAHCCTLTVKAVQTKCYHHIYHHHSIKQIMQENRCFLWLPHVKPCCIKFATNPQTLGTVYKVSILQTYVCMYPWAGNDAGHPMLMPWMASEQYHCCHMYYSKNNPFWHSSDEKRDACKCRLWDNLSHSQWVGWAQRGWEEEVRTVLHILKADYYKQELQGESYKDKVVSWVMGMRKWRCTKSFSCHSEVNVSLIRLQSTYTCMLIAVTQGKHTNVRTYVYQTHCSSDVNLGCPL